jgi:DNA-binding transcriptional ArsR family regulator
MSLDRPRTDVRDVSDPRAMRALAHPVRLALLDALGIHGPLTATEAGEAIGESPTTCSFHFRQLAKYGFVEEAGRGAGRRRPWRLAHVGLHFTDVHDDPATATAATALDGVIRERRIGRMRAGMEARASGRRSRARASSCSTSRHMSCAPSTPSSPRCSRATAIAWPIPPGAPRDRGRSRCSSSPTASRTEACAA